MSKEYRPATRDKNIIGYLFVPVTLSAHGHCADKIKDKQKDNLGLQLTRLSIYCISSTVDEIFLQ